MTTATGTMNVNSSDPTVKKIVYNMYRDMLVSYNNKANDILATLPQHMVREDHGISQQLENMIRQTSQNLSEAEQISPQSSCTSVPPPPPPPGPGTILSKRLSTEIPDRRVEPPACVQNAMMTKDKKPFTYTPGGLDLSQIRSPRMARRISRNAHAEGTSDAGPRPSPLASQAPPGPLPPAAVAAMQAQMPVQVFPTGPPPPPPPPSSTNNGNTGGLPPSIVSPPPMNNMASPPNYQRPEIKLPANPTGMLRSTQDTQKSTSPVMEQSQNQIYNEEESNQKNKPQLGSIYIPPINNQDTQINKPGSVQTPHIKSIQSPTIQKVNQSPTPLSPTPNLNKAPTPWLTNRPSPQTKVPSWVHREESQSPSIQNQGGARVIPIQIEGRPSVLQKRPEQIQSSSVQHMPMHQEQHFQQQQMKTKSEQQSTRIIPIQVEEASYSPGFDYSGHTNINTIQQQFNRQNSTNSQQGYQMKPQFQQQFSSQIPVEQMKKLQLAEEDRTLMNKFKNQVDEDIFLHNESDPRYKGAAIPSRAFRMLQTMTDSFSGPSPHYSTVPRGPGSSRIAQTRQMSQPHSDDGAGLQQPYIPPSEQTVTEPRKYTGAAIPSRSFRILQAMTAPENCANTSQSTEKNENYSNDPNSYNNQWVFDPNYPPHPYWNNPYWGYYEVAEYSPEISSDTEQCTEKLDDSNCAQYSTFWDPYGYYSYYGYPYPPLYSPFHFYSPSDTEDYSSNDEMAFYGARFAKAAVLQQSAPKVTLNSNKDNTLQNKVTDKNNTKLPKEDAVDIKKSSIHKVFDSSGSESSESDSDTEVEDGENENKSGVLLAIKSVSDINIYNEDSSSKYSDANENYNETDSDESTEENDDITSVYHEEMQDLPHQLSIIFEESEHSDMDFIKHNNNRKNSITTTISEDDSSTTIGNGDYDSEEDGNTESTVTVRLPLKLKFSQSENNEPVTTVFVGNSEIKKDTTPLIHRSRTPTNSDSNISVTLTLTPDNNSTSTDNITFLTENNNKMPSSPTSNDDLTYETAESDSEVSISILLPKKNNLENRTKTLVEEGGNKIENTIVCNPKINNSDNMTSSTHKVSHNNSDVSIKSNQEKITPINNTSDSENDEDDEEEDDEDDSSSSSDNSSIYNGSDEKENYTNEEKLNENTTGNEQNTMQTKNQLMCINDHILNLEQIHRYNLDDKGTGNPISVKDRIKNFEQVNTTNNVKPKVIDKNTRRNSTKSNEYVSDEEADSGVTSDMSRHISETDTESECFIELKKMTHYQRAATHSRLFKLLQDECNACVDVEDSMNTEEFTDESHKTNSLNKSNMEESSSGKNKSDIMKRKEKLTLPLDNHSSKGSDSFSSSGVASPSSPTVNNRLVKELVQSLLKHKKGRYLRHLPIEKLHAAALRILQEDMDRGDTVSSSEDGGSAGGSAGGSSFLSPAYPETTNSTPAHTPQEFYGNHYNDYCDYYNTWENAGNYYEPEYDIIPSKAFKILQERTTGSVTPVFSGFLAKCPKVLSTKNVPKELQQVTETRETPPPSSSQDTKEARAA